MNREFEILNKKLDLIYEELMEMKEIFKIERNSKKIKELEYELESTKENIDRTREEQKWQLENISERKKWFRDIGELFPKEEVAVETLER